MLRRRSIVCLSLALAAPLFASTSANAQDGGPRPSPTGVTTAPPPTPPPPDKPPADRSALVPSTSPAPASPEAVTPAPPGPSPAVVNPARDQQEVAAQGGQRPTASELAAGGREIFSDDWWGHARPIIELHGYFRTRAELFHNFSLGRHSSTLQGNDPNYLYPIPLDQTYTQVTGNQGQAVTVCGSASATNKTAFGVCNSKMQTGANLRLRLDPEVHISDNLRILTQVDLLDNLVLGSTPDAYAMQPATTTTASTGAQATQANGAKANYPTGYQPAGVNGYAPIGFLTTTQGSQTAGVNAWTNSINVKRVWGEYMTPVGELRFGRMPGHWGLGMIENSGDGIDSDYQTTLDRVMFITGIKSIDLYFGAAWDFVSSGPTSANPFSVYGGQAYPTCNSCGVNQWAAFIAHRMNPDLQKLTLSRGGIVLNGGLYATFRAQSVDVVPGQTPQTADFTSAPPPPLEPRQAWALTPDLWVQLLWQKLRIEAEAATIQGQIGYLTGVNADASNPIGIQQYAVATQTEYRAIDDKLDLQFGFGWASGDPWTTTLTAPNGLRTERNGTGPIATFQFHPDYRVDLIFYRHILTRVEGSYYFRPSVSYDFIRHGDGERLGGGAAVIWSRASEFVQTPGHARDLGVELNAQLYYQSKDGSLNDDPSKLGGFYAMLQYGVFFPLAGLEYLPGDVPAGFDASLSAAQTVRLLLGIVF